MAVRMTSRTSPTQRTLEHLRARGWLADVAERRQGPISLDLFGFADLVAVHPDQRRVLLVQVTSASHFADRLAKVKATPAAALVLRAGVAVEVWAWSPGSPEPRIERVDGGSS